MEASFSVCENPNQRSHNGNQCEHLSRIELPQGRLGATSPKNSKSTYQRDNSPSFLIDALLTIARIWDQPRCPSTVNR